MKEAVKKGVRLIVIDPRETDVAKMAKENGGIWLRLRPGTNIPLLNAMLYCIFDEGLENKGFIDERVDGIDQLKEFIKDYSPERVAPLTDVPVELIREAARVYATSSRSLILYGLGVAEHKGGTFGVMALANLVLSTGHVGRQGTGINPLRGQNNVQGACDMGTLPYSLPGYQHTDDAEALRRYAKLWGVKTLPTTAGLLEPEMYEKAIEGSFKALYCIGYDPAQTQGNIGLVHKALSALDLLVYQDLFLTKTAEFAHVVLPSACFYEKDGTFTSGERRVRRVRKVVEPYGEALADWEIVVRLSKAMGYDMDYMHPSEIMEEIAFLAPPYRGISYETLDENINGQIWPCLKKGDAGTPLLYETTFPRGKASLVPVEFIMPEEDVDADYPFALITGRRLEHYNNGSMTRRADAFSELSPCELVEICEEDARAIGIRDGDKVRVVSRRGEVVARAWVTDRSKKGTVFMSFHFENALTNMVTSHGLDVKTLTPEYKICAVKIERL